MGNNPDRPFAGRQLTRAERRRADRLAAERAAARAKAMPPPEVTDRTDPVTGKPVYMPRTTHDPRRPGGAPLPDPVGGPAPTPAAGALPRPVPSPAPGVLPPGPLDHTPTRPLPTPDPAPVHKQRRPRKSWEQTPSLGAQADRNQQRSERRRKVTGPVPASTANRWLITGLLAVAGVAVFAAAQVAAGSVPTVEVFAAAGAAGLGGLYAVRRGWPASTRKVRVPGAVLALLVVAALGVGVAADPVVIEGRVLPETSDEAASVRLADQITEDLRVMAGYDDLLVADLPTARAQVAAYEPARTRLVSMSAKWTGYTDVPDPLFTAVVAHMQNAAHWQAEAIATKQKLIAEADSRLETDLETQRASFTESWLAASSGLAGIGTALGIPTSEHAEGPHE